ncbi:MAG: hypothetical protein IJ890_06385 [Clostridia bacterium]|nr:hypothetical protein [Clostridia bacterium]
MSNFYKKIEKICKENKKVAMFIDMDGTIVEYKVFPEGKLTTDTKGEFLDGEPINAVINTLREINEIDNIDLYILSLSRSNIIVYEKKIWLNKYVDFIDKNNWIIINKEKCEYNNENRDFIKAEKMMEKRDKYDFMILLDDDHKILRRTQEKMENRGCVFHLSSAVI